MFYRIHLEPLPGCSIERATRDAFIILGMLPATAQDCLVLTFNGKSFRVSEYANPTEIIKDFFGEQYGRYVSEQVSLNSNNR